MHCQVNQLTPRPMATTKLTDIELLTLNAIRSSDYYENGKGSSVWVWSVGVKFDVYTEKQIQGCLPRLQEKGLVSMDDQWTSKDERCVKITDKGYEALTPVPVPDGHTLLRLGDPITEDCLILKGGKEWANALTVLTGPILEQYRNKVNAMHHPICIPDPK